MRTDLANAFGAQALGGRGRGVDVYVRPVTADNTRRGWAVASYLCAQAKRLQIEHIVFDKRIWTAGSQSEQGWRTYRPGRRSGNSQAREHLDHVYVEVVAGS